MALNELVTNAVKYGALSTETGELAVSWRSAWKYDMSSGSLARCSRRLFAYQGRNNRHRLTFDADREVSAMPRYFFHVSHDEPRIDDADGIELPDRAAAWAQATAACGEMIKEIDGQLQA